MSPEEIALREKAGIAAIPQRMSITLGEVELTSKQALELAEFDKLATPLAILALLAKLERFEKALKPFGDYADPRGKLPSDFVLTSGSWMGKRQLTMGDCYEARAALEPT